MSKNITLHLARIGGITALLVLCIIYPFLPGEYDSLAVGLSTTTQAFGMVGLLLVPVAGLWLVYAFWKRTQRKHNLHVKSREHSFALAAVIASALVAVAVSLVAFAVAGLLLGLITAALWLYILSRLVQRWKHLKKTQAETFEPTPLYLVFIPVIALLFQLAAAAPATASSRNHAITNSAEMIQDIEAYHANYGRYPGSLSAVWKDYYPSVVGIEKFHYVQDGDAYNLFFEQPRFLFDNIGAREFVVYNKLDQHFMISHTSWILLLMPEELDTTQGWYAVHDTVNPHWKYFWFD